MKDRVSDEVERQLIKNLPVSAGRDIVEPYSIEHFHQSLHVIFTCASKVGVTPGEMVHYILDKMEIRSYFYSRK